MQRIIDNIPRIIDYDFVRSVAKEIRASLVERLHLVGDDAVEQATKYLAEDEQVSSQRHMFVQKKDRLDAVIKRLQTFGS